MPEHEGRHRPAPLRQPVDRLITQPIEFGRRPRMSWPLKLVLLVAFAVPTLWSAAHILIGAW